MLPQDGITSVDWKNLCGGRRTEGDGPVALDRVEGGQDAVGKPCWTAVNWRVPAALWTWEV